MIGHDLRPSPEHIEVPAYSIGSGMSDGHVDRAFWAHTAIPPLVDRARAPPHRT